MTSSLQDALMAMERAKDEKLKELAQIESTISQLKGLIVLAPDEALAPHAREFAGMGVSEAARTLIKAVGRPMTTRELVDGMVEWGWRTRSKNATATIHATLSNAPKEWKRNASGEWEYTGKR